MVGVHDSIGAILGAFEQTNLVALGERHWAVEDSAFRLALVRDPRFASLVNDVVVEFVNPLHQRLLDRYIVEGEQTPPARLSALWRDATQPGTWDSPVYEALLNAIRDVNLALPADRRVRVVAGDAPVDWMKVHSASGIAPFLDARDEHAARIVRREVIERNRNALLIFGAAHLYHGWRHNLTTLLESDGRTRLFVIAPVEGLQAALPPPAFLALRNTPLGETDAREFLEKGTRRVEFVNGKPVIAPVFDSPRRLDSMTDGCIDYGKGGPVFATPDRVLYENTAYGREVQRRRALLSGARN